MRCEVGEALILMLMLFLILEFLTAEAQRIAKFMKVFSLLPRRLCGSKKMKLEGCKSTRGRVEPRSYNEDIFRYPSEVEGNVAKIRYVF